MAGKWRSLTAEQFCTSIRDGTHDSPKPAERGRFLVTSRHIIGGQLDIGNAYLISQKDFDAINKRSKVDRWDVLISMIGTVGELCLIKEEPDFAIKNIGLFKSKGEVEGKWLYYYLRSSDAQQLIREQARGTTQQYIPLGALRGFPILVPDDRAEMRAIAHILGTLDDKIELNRRMNETLEAMARALFKSWFVDFDPVRAKAEGRNPTVPESLANLFPARLVDSELGEIPEGWDEGSFGSFISQRSERVGPREVVVLSAVASGKLAKSDDHFTKRVYSKETDKYLVVEQWDFAYNPSRINIGSIGMLEEEILGGVSPVYVVVRPKPAYRWFLEFSIRRAHTTTWINTLASGSVRQSLSYRDFASIPCVVPTETVAQEFNRRWSTLREGIRSRGAESRTLAALRDTLLPRLISGELRVQDAEKFLKERGV